MFTYVNNNVYLHVMVMTKDIQSSEEHEEGG